MATNIDALVYASDGRAVLAPGSRLAAYVRSSGVQDGDLPEVAENLVTTLNGALIRCRSARNDVVVVLPGHAENVSTADQMSNLVAGTQIVGIGFGANRPTFTWSAATATFLFDVANVRLLNCILEMAGDPASSTALSVAAPITVSAAGCAIEDCLIRVGVDADQLATIGITTTAAGDDLSLRRCHVFGATTSEVTTAIRLVGADRLVIEDCVVQCATSSTTVGSVQFVTTASTQIAVRRSTFINRKAASVHAVTGMAACTGVFDNCNFGILDNATLAGLVTPGDLMGFRCRTVNLAGEEGAEATTQST